MLSGPNKFSPGGHIIFEKRGFSAYFLGVQTHYWGKRNHIYTKIISKIIFPKKSQNATYYDRIYDIADIRHIYSKFSKIPNFSKIYARTKNYNIMGWIDLWAAHQAHFGVKNSKFAWNKSSAHLVHCEMICRQVDGIASSWSNAYVSKVEGMPCITSENSIQTPKRLSQEFVEQMLKCQHECQFWTQNVTISGSTTWVEWLIHSGSTTHRFFCRGKCRL